jgi:hypothetical protein
MSNIFEQASKLKLRIATAKGMQTVEDLWDLSLESLDTIAVAVDKQLETAGKKSFIGKKDTTNKVLELQLEVLKHIIGVKLEEKATKAARVERNAQLAHLRELAANKSTEALAGKSLEEINKMIAELTEAE